MMGVQHALGGSVLAVAALPWLEAQYGLTAGQEVLTVALAVGGGMVCDLDMPGSTIGRTYGPVTNVLARLVAFVARGHRKGTHCLLGLLVFALVADRAAVAGGLTSALLVWIMLGVACRAAGLAVPGHRSLTAIIHAFTMGLLTVLVLASGVDPHVPLVAGMVLGTVSHVVLDMLTDKGCPLLYPFSRRCYGVDIFTTGSRWTSPLVTGGLTVALVVLAVQLTTFGSAVLYLSGLV